MSYFSVLSEYLSHFTDLCIYVRKRIHLPSSLSQNQLTNYGVLESMESEMFKHGVRKESKEKENTDKK